MKHFSKALGDAMVGPPRISQTEVADRAHLLKSKLSRLLAGKHACDAQTLDAVLSAFPDKQVRANLVSAYVRDLISDSALEVLQAHAPKSNWEGLEPRLSGKGRQALKFLLKQKGLDSEIESLLIALARAIGYKA